MANAERGVPSANSERVVVDEIFADERARILRAERKADAAPDDFSINSWGDEREEIISVWRLEAFAGFQKGEHLREGDVFLVADGRELTLDYKPIAREQAKLNHLLIDWATSKQDARMESKRQSSLLSATKLASDKKVALETLVRRIDKKFDSKS
jgi:hypothetical protein